MTETKDEKIFTKDECVKIFQDNKTVEIVFEKKDGTLRTMKCTRNFDMIPEEHKPKSEKPIVESMPVFDLDAKGWRSFTIKNLKSFKAVE